MKLAVIIPTYDSLDTLKVLIDQLLVPSYSSDLTIYVIEDGQKEDTIIWLKTKVILKPQLKAIFHKANEGIAPSWNDGLKEAEKDGCTHFAVLNDDVELPENWREVCESAFVGNTHLISLDAPCPIPLTGWFFMMDKICLDQVGYFDEQFAPFTSEDADYWYRYEASGLGHAKVQLEVKHHGSKTMNKLEPERFKEVWNDNWKKLRKKYPNIRMQDNLR